MKESLNSPRERRAQKARTRETLLEGARALIAKGAPVTVAAAASEVGISKATAYRYFSDPAAMAAEAGLAISVKPYEAVVSGAKTPREKAIAVSLYIFDLTVENEAAFRQFLARNLDATVKAGAKQVQRRGARRMQMFETALDDIRDQISPDAFRSLVAGLSMASGSEAMIGLYDIAEVDAATARRVVLDTAEALLDRHLPAGT